MINNYKHINSIGIIKIVNVILTLNCPIVPNLSNGALGRSISLTYLRGLGVPELTEEDMLELEIINSKLLAKFILVPKKIVEKKI